MPHAVLVGWERQRVDDKHQAWHIPALPVPGGQDGEVQLAPPVHEVGRTIGAKSVLCPLRAPWGARPVLLPGDSLKGLLRHELGALLGAPMERVAERSYSYRPNSLYPSDPNPRLVPRLARVPDGGVQVRPLYPHSPPPGADVRVPVRLELPPSQQEPADVSIRRPRGRIPLPWRSRRG